MKVENGAGVASWVVLWTKPRAEKVVARVLVARGVTHWLPTMNVRRRWSDRWRDVEFPLFPCYLFVEAPGDMWSSLIRISGVLTVVKQGAQPARISLAELDELRTSLARAVEAEPNPQLEYDFVRGERVRVIDGPLVGAVGVVREVRGSRRLLIGVAAIGRALSVSLDAAQIAPIDR